MKTDEVLDRMEQTPRFEHVKLHEFKLEKIDEETRTIEGFASTPVKDLQDEIVLPTAFSRDLPDYMKIPIVTWMHQWYEVPIGQTLQAEVRDEGLFVRIYINTTEKARDVWTAIKEGSVRALSIGWDGGWTPEYGYFDEEEDAWVWTRMMLREIAVVSLPANREALFGLAKSLGLTMPGKEELLQLHHGAKEAAEETRVEEDLKRLGGAAEAIGNISHHWSKTGGAPSARLVDAALSPISDLMRIVKAGRVLSATNRTAVEDAIEALQGVLASPPGPPLLNGEGGKGTSSSEDEGKGMASPPGPPLLNGEGGNGTSSSGAGTEDEEAKSTITVVRAEKPRLAITR